MDGDFDAPGVQDEVFTFSARVNDEAPNLLCGPATGKIENVRLSEASDSDAKGNYEVTCLCIQDNGAWLSAFEPNTNSNFYNGPVRLVVYVEDNKDTGNSDRSSPVLAISEAADGTPGLPPLAVRISPTFCMGKGAGVKGRAQNIEVGNISVK